MSSFQFDIETATQRTSADAATVHLSNDWNIGDNPNGGYLMAIVLNALASLPGLASSPLDPLTLTAHFLRPGLAGHDGLVTGEVLKLGRTISSVRGTLHQDDKPRVEMLVGLGDLSALRTQPRADSVPMFELPPPAQCIDRAELAQGVDLPILQRVEVRVPVALIEPNPAGPSVMAGWIRFADGRPPDTRALPLFADAFPPSVFTRYGNIGWVPTLEMTVQVRRQPVSGWVAAQFQCDDLHDGTMIETGSLWDEAGNLVARCRQLGLLIEQEEA